MALDRMACEKKRWNLIQPYIDFIQFIGNILTFNSVHKNLTKVQVQNKCRGVIVTIKTIMFPKFLALLLTLSKEFSTRAFLLKIPVYSAASHLRNTT